MVGQMDIYTPRELKLLCLVQMNHTAVGLRGWWRPEETGTATPSISLGYDTTQYSGVPSGTSDSTDMWFVGLQWQDIFNPDDKIGLAFGQPQRVEGETIDPFLYELYYKYKVNDSVSITPNNIRWNFKKFQ